MSCAVDIENGEVSMPIWVCGLAMDHPTMLLITNTVVATACSHVKVACS